ncbi:MAG: zinc-dependent metalloprotease [Pseudonocardiales bacterium]|nr:zinc-dependent metalloprotease [Pseudonocardiales bacterium]MBV9032767.1 zinc-dependent metalloprotease [Pseudonocardiales bacterium]MBV9143987.1 zinc-dependent metalloprotease [Pseudonocardiales bacterium]
MSDVPFGFGSHDPRDPDRRDPPDDGGGGPDPAGPFGAGGFDVGALGQMLTQLGQMLSQGAAGGGGPVNYDLAKQMALQKLSTTGLPSAQQAAAVTDAVRLAELWLDPATALPAGTHSSAAWAPRDWVELTLPTWQRLCDPVARRMASSWMDALPSEVRQTAGPLVAMVEQMGGVAFGSQLGAALAQLGGEVLTSTEIGLPLGPLGVAALLPAAIEQFSTGLGRKSSEVTVFLAAREAAHHRLFGHVPWLRQRLLATVEEFAHGIQVDTDALQELAHQVDPTDPQSMDQLLSSGLLEQRHSPEQNAALSRLETLLALVEGWVDVIVADALGERLPGSDALRETLRRRRASGGPAEHTFATLVGLELRPRKLRAATGLWRRLTEQHGIEGRDALWNHPDLLPTTEDLDDPAMFVDRAARYAADLDDPITALERTAADAPREQTPPDASGDDPPAPPTE